MQNKNTHPSSKRDEC